MIDPKLLTFSWTDQGNAEALAYIFGNKIRFCPDSELWYVWNGHTWEATHQGDIRQMAMQTAKMQRAAWEAVEKDDSKWDLRDRALRYYRAGENRGRMVAATAVAADLPALRIKFAQFDADVWKLGTRNGEIDLKTGRFAAPNPSNYLTKSCSVEFDASAQCPKWEKFVREIMCGDEAMIEVVQRMLGYCLTGSVEEQVMFMCVGEGANGKSTMFNVVRRVLGDYAKLTPFSTFNAATRSEQTNDLAALAGARYVAIAESDEDAFLAEAKLKAATGGDPITCRFLNKEFFTYHPQFKVWMSCNQLPGMRGMNHGNFRRPVIIHFKASFDGAARITNLEDQLVAEGPGILNWMLEGLGRWHGAKLSQRMPEVLAEARQEYRNEMDMLGKWMDERVESRPVKKDEKVPKEWTVPSMELFADYFDYMKKLNHKAKSHKTWSQEMKAKGFVPRKSNGVMVYDGVRLNEFQQEYIRVVA